MLGHIAKADGVVSQTEIEITESIIKRMNMDQQSRLIAIEQFGVGKQSNFNFRNTLINFRQNCYNRNLFLNFIDLLFQIAYSDGELHENETRIIIEASKILGINEFELNSIAAMNRIRYGSNQQLQNKNTPVEAAYNVLGLRPEASDSEVKRKYKKLISENHPDKLVSQGVPENMIEMATEKTKEITWAYDAIMNHRKSNQKKSA